MNKYLYNDIEFTEDEISLAAENKDLSVSEYLKQNNDISLLENTVIEPEDGDPKKDKKEKVNVATVTPDQYPSSKYIDKLRGKNVNEPVTDSNDLNQAPAVSDNTTNIDLPVVEEQEELEELELPEEKAELGKFNVKNLRLKANTKRALKDIDYYLLSKITIPRMGKDDVQDKYSGLVSNKDFKEDNINSPFEGESTIGKFITKKEGKTTKYYKLEDIINGDDFNLIEKLAEVNYDIEKFAKSLGDDYGYYTNEVEDPIQGIEFDWVTDADLGILPEIVVKVEGGSNAWQNSTLNNLSVNTVDSYLDGVLNENLFRTTEDEGSVALDLLLPKSFEVKPLEGISGFLRDKIEVTAPNGEKEVFQFDLSPTKDKEEILREKSKLKKFVLNNWDSDQWGALKDKADKIKMSNKILLDTPVDQGGVGISEKQQVRLDKKFNEQKLAKSIVAGDLSRVENTQLGVERFQMVVKKVNEDTKTARQAYKLINLERKNKGLPPLTFTIDELLNKDNEYVVNSKDPLQQDFKELVDKTRSLLMGDAERAVLEDNVEKWSEKDGGAIFGTGDKKAKNLGFGIASSIIMDRESKFLLEQAQASINTFVAKSETAKNRVDLFPERKNVNAFFNENSFANYNYASTEAGRINELSRLTVMPRVDEDGNVMEDVYLKVNGQKNDKGQDLIYTIKAGENLYEYVSKDLILKENGQAVAFMPIGTINRYNDLKTQSFLSSKMVQIQYSKFASYIEDIPSFKDQIDVWSKNYNELERAGVSLGISGLNLAKDLTMAAAALTMYVNPMYWAGKYLDIDAFEALAHGNVEMQKWLDTEKSEYNFSTSTFDEGNFSSWEGLSAYFEWGTDMFTDTAPIMAVMILSGGSSSYAAAISSSIAGLSGVGSKQTEIDLKNDEIKDQIKDINKSNMSDETKKAKIDELNNQIITTGGLEYMSRLSFAGANEFVFAYLTTGQYAAKFNKIIRNQGGNAALEPLYTSWGQKIKAGGKSWLKESNTEGLGEVGVTFFDNLVEQRPLSTGLVEAYAGGFALTGILDGAGKAFSSSSTINFSSNKEIKLIKNTNDILVEKHKLIDDINLQIAEAQSAEQGPLKKPENILNLNNLVKQKVEVQGQIEVLNGEMKEHHDNLMKKVTEDGMRNSAAAYYVKNQEHLAKLRTEALNLAADPDAATPGSDAFVRLQEINAQYKKMQSINQSFLDNEVFAHEWFVQKSNSVFDNEALQVVNEVESEAVTRIQERINDPNYKPDQAEINTEAVKIIDERTYDTNSAKAEVIADQGNWNYKNSETKADGVKDIETAFNEVIDNLSDVDANEKVEVKTEDGGTVEITKKQELELQRDQAIKGVESGEVNGFFAEDINTQFNIKENAVNNQKPGVPLHESGHGATKKLIQGDPESFNESGKILVEFLRTEQTDVFNKMILEGTDGLRNSDGTFDFEEVFSSFVEEIAAGNIDLQNYKDFTAFFAMKLNQGLMKASNGEFRVDFKGTNDINKFFAKLGEEIGLGKVSSETLAELEARSETNETEVIDINRDQESQPSKIAASKTKQSKTSNTRAELVAENKKLLKEKPKGFMDIIASNVKKIKAFVKDGNSAPSSTLGKRDDESISNIAKKTKKSINDKFEKVKDKWPNFKEGLRKNNPKADAFFPKIDKDLDGMIRAKAKNFVTQDKNVVDLTKNLDIEELVQAVKVKLLPDLRGFDKTNDSLYGYINSRLGNRIGDVLKTGEVFNDFSSKDIDNLGSSDIKEINKTKTEIETVPDVNLRESLNIERDSPLGEYVMETTKKVLSTPMPKFKYVRKNRGGKRTDVTLADVKKVLATNPTGDTKRQADRDLAGIYKQFSKDLEGRLSAELRTAFAETFGSRADYTNWLTENAEAISDMSIEKLVALERLVKPEDKIFTEVIKENLSVEEVKRFQGTGLLVSATTNQGPTLYKKLNPDPDAVLGFFDIKGSKKGTRKDALADKISGELALNATMEVAGNPEVLEKFELGLENSGTGEVVLDAYLDDVSKAIGRGVNLKFSKGFLASNADLELKNDFLNKRKQFFTSLKARGFTDENVDLTWQETFGNTKFNSTEPKKDWTKDIKKGIKGLSKNIARVDSILGDPEKSLIIASIIDEEVDLNDTERAELIFKARKEFLTTKKNQDFDETVRELARNLGLTAGYAAEQLAYDIGVRGVDKWQKDNGKKSALQITGVGPSEIGGAADMEATIGGNAFYVELKLNNARFGSVGVVINTGANGKVNFTLTKELSFNQDLLNMLESARSDIQSWVDKANEIGKEMYAEKWVKYKIGEVLDKRVLDVLQKEGFQRRIQRKTVLSADSVGEGYSSKENGTAYMNIAKQGGFSGEKAGGLFKLRNTIDSSLEDPANLGNAVPFLDGEAIWSLAIAKTSNDSVGGPMNYKKAGVELIDGKLPGSPGFANIGLRIQVTKLSGLPDSKIDMFQEQGIIDLQNVVNSNDLNVKKGEASKENIKTNSKSKVVPNIKASKTTNPEVIRQAEILDKALNLARDPNAPTKKIRIFDFDDTLARTNSNVLYTMPDGKTGSLTAEEFARDGDRMTNEGVEWDFSEFSQVIDGKPGPLLEVAKMMDQSKGNRDLFVLTARPQAAAPAIKAFLDQNGLNIPIENITGLADSSPLGKSNWIVDKAAEGYNDFYFADDAVKNIDAADIALSLVDGKSRTQLAKINTIKFSKTGKSEKLNWTTDEAGNIKTTFEIGNKKYNFNLDARDSVGSFDVEFNLDGRIDITGTGDSVKVVRTVYNGLVDLISQNDKINKIEFSARKGEESRVRLYTTLMESLGKKLGWETDVWDVKSVLNEDGGSYDFELIKPSPVSRVLNVVDTKSNTQQAKIKFSKNAGEIMNDIIFDATGIESYKEYSSMRAKAKGRTRNSWSLIPPSAQDFGGLLYKMLAKGAKGEAQWSWMQENLIKPFSRAMNDLSVAQNQLMSDFRALKSSLKGIPTNLKKKAFGGFTYEDITRIAAWDRQGIKIDGLSERDLSQIRDFASGNKDMDLFVNQLIELGKEDGYHYPGGDWLAGTITTDFIGGLRKETRPRLLKQWSDNIDLAFDNKTLNKLEAAYGPKYREAIEDSIRRMRTGQNRKQGISRLEARFQDYINNSVGAVMFLNARSAVLQTISAANFINWSDNNPLKAGAAFANQKQYWSDFMRLMNSDFLVDRRNGLKINVSESEIAEAAKTTGNSAKGVISYLLSRGFVLTQFADSFAIATGGSTYFRNRTKTYVKQGMSQSDAEAKAFLDFREKAEESQQSARADKISQQQASTLGRFILAFANTPSQYARIMDKAGRDLVAGRGDPKANISKILYYGFVQNMIFTALQSAMFASGFGDDEDDVSLEYFKDQGMSDKEAEQAMKYYNSKNSKKDMDTANSMLDNILRGVGVQGVILSTAKNVLIDLYRRSEKEGQYPGPEYGDNTWKLLEVSPPISIKTKKYKGGLRDYEMNSWRPEAKEPFNINNPSYRAAAKVISAVTNVPIDRVFQKMENIQGAMDNTNEDWQRIAMILGWPKWQLESETQRADRFKTEKEGRKDYRKQNKLKNTRQYKPKKLLDEKTLIKQDLEKQVKDLFKLNKSAQIDSLRSLGLTTDAIKRLKYEEDRVNKIIELNKR